MPGDQPKSSLPLNPGTLFPLTILDHGCKLTSAVSLMMWAICSRSLGISAAVKSSHNLYLLGGQPKLTKSCRQTARGTLG